jgi:FtsP/CotA-like multicopper oxidase with cupredoxin domain
VYHPAERAVRPEEREFWRVLNASADTFFDLQLRFGPTLEKGTYPQSLELVAIDGSPVDQSLSQSSHVFLAPGARAEFIINTPPIGVLAQLVSLKYDTGPDGELSPFRVIANVRSRRDAPNVESVPATYTAAPQPFFWLENVAPVRQRKLYFSDNRYAAPSCPPCSTRSNVRNPNEVKYFVTAEGEVPKTFSMDFKKPDITVFQGTVEDWIIENRTREAHTFHIHQVHFQLLDRNGRKVNEPALRDTIDIPYWDGMAAEYPKVKLRMDFRGPEIVGTFVFHCHILEHEDAGMMGSIQVLPAPR